MKVTYLLLFLSKDYSSRKIIKIILKSKLIKEKLIVLYETSTKSLYSFVDKVYGIENFSCSKLYFCILNEIFSHKSLNFTIHILLYIYIYHISNFFRYGINIYCSCSCLTIFYGCIIILLYFCGYVVYTRIFIVCILYIQCILP